MVPETKINGTVRIGGAYDLQRLQTGKSGHAVIGNHQIPFALVQDGFQGRSSIDTFGMQIKMALTQFAGQQFAIVFAILDKNGA